MKIKGYFAAALVLLCLCGCGDSNSTAGTDSAASSEAETIVSETSAEVSEAAPADGENAAQNSTEGGELAGVFTQIKSSVELPDMVELNDKLIERYYGITPDMVADYAGGVDSSGVGQDEIALFKAADDANADAIEQALQTRYDSKLAQQENYNADEAEKIRNCKVEKNGLYVTLIISSDADAITEIVNGAIG